MKNLKKIAAVSLALLSSIAMLSACSGSEEETKTKPSQPYPEGVALCALIKGDIDKPCKLHRVKEYDGIYWKTDCGFHNDFDEVGGDYTYYGSFVFSDIERIYTPSGIKFSTAQYTIGPATAYNLNEYTLCTDCYPQQTQDGLNK